MKLISKSNKDWYVQVNVKRNKITLNKHGMVVLEKGQHYGSTVVRPDIIERDYIIPEGVSIDE